MPKAPSLKTSKQKVKVLPKSKKETKALAKVVKKAVDKALSKAAKKTKKTKKTKEVAADRNELLCDDNPNLKVLKTYSADTMENPFPPSEIGSYRRMIAVSDDGRSTFVGEMQRPFTAIPRSGKMNPVQFCTVMAQKYAH